MMTDETKTEQIDRYLDGEMMPAEKLAFEQLIQQQDELRLEIEAQKAVKNYLYRKGEQNELQRLFDTFHADLTQPEKEKSGKIAEPVVVSLEDDRKKKRRSDRGGLSYWAIAASVALVMVGVWTVIKQSNKADTDIEIRTNDDRKPFQIPLLVWENQNGVRTKTQTLFKTTVIINDGTHTLHYRFSKTFELYLSPTPRVRPKLSLEYDKTNNSYKLWMDGQVYRVSPNDTITPLK